MRTRILGALLISLLAACSTTPETTAPVEDRTPSPVTTPAGGAAGSGAAGGSGVSSSGAGVTTAPIAAGAGAATTATPARSGAGQNPLRDPANILSKRTVYFDYDSFAIKDEFRSILEAHAKYLQSNKNARMTIQGNTDERGSPEYNIALGQKRADAVRQLMRVLGANESQIETVSFGEEKPRNQGHDEKAWAENRRAEIVYAGE